MAPWIKMGLFETGLKIQANFGNMEKRTHTRFQFPR